MINVKNNLISHQELVSALNYCAETGVFVWRNGIGNIKAGTIAGSEQKHGHRVIRIKKHRYYAHRLAWFYVTGNWPKKDIDHIDGNPRNNKFNNLRDITRSENIQNQNKSQKGSKVNLLGVSLGYKKYCAQIRVNKKRIYLGVFDTPEEAHQSYLNKKREIHAGCTI